MQGSTQTISLSRPFDTIFSAGCASVVGHSGVRGSYVSPACPGFVLCSAVLQRRAVFRSIHPRFFAHAFFIRFISALGSMSLPGHWFRLS